jgi:two-component system, OmpR family, aerobic respiration control sensor histidine kinase ArcB
LIFMDIGLPDMDGYEVTRRIRSHEISKNTPIPIIALTAHADSENQQHCLDATMNAIITKPLRKKEAADILNTFIPRRQKCSQQRQPDSNTSEEKIIDFEHAKMLLGGGDEAIMNEMLSTLIDSLPWEVKKLQEAYQQENWEAISAIIHKLKGGTSYCGTMRLNSACIKLDSCIKFDLSQLRHDLYQQLLSEIEVLQKFMCLQHHKVS